MKRMRFGSFTIAAVVVLSSLARPGAGLAQPTNKAFIFDSGARTITALELPSAKVLATLPLEGSPQAILASPDGSRLIVLDRGPGDAKRDRGYKATGKSAATVVDSATLAVVARVELGWGIEPPGGFFSADGSRLAIICPGYDAKNAAEALPRELVTLDPRTGKVTGRLTLERGPVAVRATRDGRTLLLVERLPRGSDPSSAQSRLWTVDLAGPSIAAKVDLGAFGFLEVDEQADQLYIVSGGVGKEARKQEGELRVVRGADVAATLKVAPHPRLIAREGELVYVVGEKAVTLVDPVGLRVVATLPLGSEGKSLVDEDDAPTELKTSADGKRGFVLYGLDERLVVLDLEQKKAIGATKTGRGGKKFLRGLGNVAAWSAALSGGAMGQILAAPFRFHGGSASQALVVRPDGRFAYALDVKNKDVTVVDANTAEAVEKIGGGGRELQLLTGGTAVAAASGSEILLLDTASNKKATVVELPGFRSLVLSPDGAHAVALGERTVLCLDGTTGKELARLTSFGKPEAVIFAKH
jgi:DNA-binding beta-propeller fold protein YncE